MSIDWVTTISQRDGFANDHAGTFDAVLKADVGIIEKQIGSGSLRATEFFQDEHSLIT